MKGPCLFKKTGKFQTFLRHPVKWPTALTIVVQFPRYDWTAQFNTSVEIRVNSVYLVSLESSHPVSLFRLTRCSYWSKAYRPSGLPLRCGARIVSLTLTLLPWRIWWAPTNASKWQMGFNSAFKGLISYCHRIAVVSHVPSCVIVALVLRMLCVQESKWPDSVLNITGWRHKSPHRCLAT